MQFSPYHIGTMSLKNRWIMLAAHTGFAEGTALGERDYAFYEERAKGGAAAVTMVLAVNEDGALKGMYQGGTLEEDSLRILADKVHQYDCRLIVQLFHCGRNESGKHHEGKALLAPSAVASPIFRTEPREMTEAELEETKEAFAKTAALCRKCGADAVEISVSAGYLLSEFLSPLTNLRKDCYGYEKDQGMTYPLEVLAAVRQAVDDLPMLVKVSGAQMLDGGYDLTNTVVFCRKAREWADAFTVTGGWHESPVEQISYFVEKGAYGPFAAAVRKYTELPVIACNRIQDEETAERLLEEGVCDLVGSARAFLADPHFVEKLEKKEIYNPCQGCNHCIADVLKGKELKCAFCPETGREYMENQRRKIATRKEVLVIGGGPAGMYAAKKAAERGFKTTLVCQEAALGGQLKLAKLPPHKEDLGRFVSWLEQELERLEVNVLLGQKADVSFVMEKKPYLTVIATGSKPLFPQLEGLEREDASLAQEVLAMTEEEMSVFGQGQTILIGGGSLGMETAAYLMAKVPEAKIKILEQGSKMGKDLGALARPLLRELKQAGVQLMADSKAVSVSEKKVFISLAGQTFFVQADHIITAVGSEAAPEPEIAMALMDERLSYAVVGDADHPADVGEGLESVFSLFSRFYLA
ncbi:FAD-dependent oxidoreductase [Anaerotignum lactatifermentans]|uniref:FAD-dependent oxidoreductase n=1 Tax=Anaerotignum lactatifermentans TaxID=160404 RepID=A0ABS2G7U8_9FIRM|nr:FAD-dependent oxidoreductase [Anaerotignum lactatifermentans]MBM6828199.1 FAD-dependent oxidoreductase [Anaerotignum lactatifermentans]MBM6876638.1 FAD-dependent oxidoreductase [Anaerotignum lactatifermentans]MBM6949782.1 FAD-dependent oxidoreductase [Anaerotignum lactatifermentans]